MSGILGDTSAPSIWVTGPDRSGTTLMYALLGSHPNISMVRRTNMWRWFYRRFGDLSETENLDRCLDVMTNYRRMDVLDPDRDRIRREFSTGSRTYGRLFALFHEHHAARLGRTRWGDKSLHAEHHAGDIFSEFPNARIIHLLRDPRDRHASVTRRYEGRAKGMGSVTGRWIASTVAAQRNQKRYPRGYVIVRYEDLATAPERTLRTVCDFVGEEYDPVMLDMRSTLDHAEGNSSFESLPQGTISTRSIGRFRTVLEPHDIAELQGLTGRWMRRFGYEKEDVHLSSRSRIALHTLEVPASAMRVGGWVLQDALRRRRGESVPEERLARSGERS